MVGVPVCLGEGMTQSGVEYIVWQRGLRILHYCHLSSNSQCWSNCQLNSKSNSPKWSPSLKYCVSSWRLVYSILLSKKPVTYDLPLLYSDDLSFKQAKQKAGVFLLTACHFLRMTYSEVGFTSLFHRSNYNSISEVCKTDALDLIDISTCTEGDFNEIPFISAVYYNKWARM